MKIVVPCDGEQIANDFATCDTFRFYVTDEDRLLMKKDLSFSASGFKTINTMLLNYMATAIICNGIDPQSVQTLQKNDFVILAEVTGSADEAIDHLLHDELIANDHPISATTGCSGNCSSCGTTCSSKEQ